MKNHITLLITALLSLNANAAIVTVEPDDFSAGAVLNNAVEGVTLSTVAGGNVYASEEEGCADHTPGCHGAPTGTRVFGNSSGINSSWNYTHGGSEESFYVEPDPIDDLGTVSYSYADLTLMAVFGYPVNSVWIDLLTTDIHDPISVSLYRKNGDLIKHFVKDCAPWSEYVIKTESEGEYNACRFNIRSDSSHIGFMIAGGSFEGSVLDRLAFEVPEPSSGFLLTAGLLATIFVFTKRKKKRLIPSTLS